MGRDGSVFISEHRAVSICGYAVMCPYNEAGCRVHSILKFVLDNATPSEIVHMTPTSSDRLNGVGGKSSSL